MPPIPQALSRADREEGERVAANLRQQLREVVGVEAMVVRDLLWLVEYQLKQGTRLVHRP